MDQAGKGSAEATHVKPEGVCSPEEYQHSFLGQVVSRVELRLESMELKVMTLSKVVRLLQDYTEKKDQQY